MGNILQFPKQPTHNVGKTSSGKKKKSEAGSAPEQGEKAVTTNAAIVDLKEKIAHQIEEDRRKINRVVMNEFISAHVDLPGRGLMRVILKNITDTGIAFDLLKLEGQFKKGEKIEMRFYLNHETYFKFDVDIVHVKLVPSEDVYRHGCRIAEDSINHVALHHFLQFLQNIAASLKTDRGDRIVSNIYS